MENPDEQPNVTDTKIVNISQKNNEDSDPDHYPSDYDSDNDSFSDYYDESVFEESINALSLNPDHSSDAGEETLEETNDRTFVEGFEQCYICSPLSAINKEHLEDGNRIIMPESALELLANLDIDYPMMFEIKKLDSDRVSHCGVLEFSSEEGFVCLPDWMMKNLELDEGDLVKMKNASLKKGTYMKIQPHQTAFIHLPDAKDVLEKALKDYSCVTTGDTICIPQNQARFLIDIVETKPERAISVVETDCVVDFAPPLDYKEPEKKPREEEGKDLEKKQQQEKAAFQPFSGRGRRLDGVLVESASSFPVDYMTNRVHGRSNLPKKFDVCNCEPSKSSSSSGQSGRENSKCDEKKFKPFTGKKHTLSD